MEFCSVMPNSNVVVLENQGEANTYEAISSKVVDETNTNNDNESVNKEQFEELNDPIYSSSIYIKNIMIALTDLQTSVKSLTVCESLVNVLKKEVFRKLNTIQCAVEKEYYEEVTKYPKKLPISESLTPSTSVEHSASSVFSNSPPVSTNILPVSSSMSTIIALPNQSITSNQPLTDKTKIHRSRTFYRNLRRRKSKILKRMQKKNEKIARKNASVALAKNFDNNTEINIDGNQSHTSSEMISDSTVQLSKIPKNEKITSTETNNCYENIPSIDEDMEVINEILRETPVQQTTILSAETSTWSQDNDKEDITTGTVIIERICNKLGIKTDQLPTAPTDKTVKSLTPFHSGLLRVLMEQYEVEEIDYDKAFLVSLLPFIKNMNDDQKIEIRLKFLQIICNFSKSNTTLTLTPHCTTLLSNPKSLKPDLSNSKSLNPNMVNNSCGFPQQNTQPSVLIQPKQINFQQPLFPLPQYRIQQPFPFQQYSSQ